MFYNFKFTITKISSNILLLEYVKRLVNLTKTIWPKIGLNMTETDQLYLFEHTEKWQWRKLTCWTRPKMIEFDQKLKIEFFGLIHLFMLYSNVHVCHCGNFYWNFRSCSTSSSSSLSFFGHVQRFRSCSLGLIDLIMLTTLYVKSSKKHIPKRGNFLKFLKSNSFHIMQIRVAV